MVRQSSPQGMVSVMLVGQVNSTQVAWPRAPTSNNRKSAIVEMTWPNETTEINEHFIRTSLSINTALLTVTVLSETLSMSIRKKPDAREFQGRTCVGCHKTGRRHEFPRIDLPIAAS